MEMSDDFPRKFIGFYPHYNELTVDISVLLAIFSVTTYKPLKVTNSVGSKDMLYKQGPRRLGNYLLMRVRGKSGFERYVTFRSVQ